MILTHICLSGSNIVAGIAVVNTKTDCFEEMVINNITNPIQQSLEKDVTGTPILAPVTNTHNLRWWLKLFFYLLDVGTTSALVLYREAMNNSITNKMSIVDYKTKLVNLLVGDRISKPLVTIPIVHELVRKNRRHICTYCAILLKTSCIRYVCAVLSCNLPLCCVGHGRSDTERLACDRRVF